MPLGALPLRENQQGLSKAPEQEAVRDGERLASLSPEPGGWGPHRAAWCPPAAQQGIPLSVAGTLTSLPSLPSCWVGPVTAHLSQVNVSGEAGGAWAARWGLLLPSPPSPAPGKEVVGLAHPDPGGGGDCAPANALSQTQHGEDTSHSRRGLSADRG